MKNLTKRMLAIILSIMMVFSLMPAISATDAAENTDDEAIADGEIATLDAVGASGDYTYLPITVRDYATDGILFGYNPTTYNKTVGAQILTDDRNMDPLSFLAQNTGGSYAETYYQTSFGTYSLPVCNVTNINRFSVENVTQNGYDSSKQAFKFTVASSDAKLQWLNIYMNQAGNYFSHLVITYSATTSFTVNYFFNEGANAGGTLFGNGDGNRTIPSTGGVMKTRIIQMSDMINDLGNNKTKKAGSFRINFKNDQNEVIYIRSIGFIWSQPALATVAVHNANFSMPCHGKGTGWFNELYTGNGNIPYVILNGAGTDPYFSIPYDTVMGRPGRGYNYTKYIFMRYRTTDVTAVQIYWRQIGGYSSSYKYLITDGQWHDIVFKVDAANTTSGAAANEIDTRSRIDLIPETSGVKLHLACYMLMTEEMLTRYKENTGSKNLGTMVYENDNGVIHTSDAYTADGSYRAITGAPGNTSADVTFYNSSYSKYSATNLASNKYLRFEYKVKRGGFHVKYTTSAGSNQFTITPTNDGKWHTAIVDLSGHSQWSGTLQKLALAGTTYNSENQYLAVKSVRMFPTYDAAYYYNPNATNNSAFANSLTSPTYTNGKLTFPEATVNTFKANLKTALSLGTYTGEANQYNNYNYIDTALATTLRSKITGGDGTYAAAIAKDLSTVNNVTTYYDAAVFLLNNLFSNATGYTQATENLPYMLLQNNGSGTFTFNSSAYVKENGVGLYNGSTATAQFSPITTVTTDYDGANSRYKYSSNYVNDGKDYDYTIEGHGKFVYKAGQTFTVAGDDNVFVFVNGTLRLSTFGTLDLSTCGLTAGNTYTLDLFYLQRSGKTSAFSVSTNIDFVHDIDVQTDVVFSYDEACTQVLDNYDVLNANRDYYITASVKNTATGGNFFAKNVSITVPGLGAEFTSAGLSDNVEIVKCYINGTESNESAVLSALASLQPNTTVEIVAKYSSGDIESNERVTLQSQATGTLALSAKPAYTSYTMVDTSTSKTVNKVPTIDLYVKAGTTTTHAINDYFKAGTTLVGASTYTNGSYTAAACTNTKAANNSSKVYASGSGLACAAPAAGYYENAAYVMLTDGSGNSYGPYAFNINSYTNDITDKAVIDYSLDFTLPAASGLGKFNTNLRNDTAVAYDLSTGAGITATKNNDNSVDFEISSFASGVNTFSADIYVLANGYEGTTPKITEGVVLNYTLAIVPANVMYYEELFGGINYSDKVVTGTVAGSSSISQSVNNNLPYGYDDAYANNQPTSNIDAEEGYLHWGGRLDFDYGTVLGSGGLDGFGNNYNFSAGTYAGIDTTQPGYSAATEFATFTFTGEGFELLTTTNFSSAMIQVRVYDSSSKLVARRTVVTSYTNGSVYQVPVVSVNNLARGSYTVKVYASVPVSADAYAGMSTCFYIDGIRVFNTLSDTDAATYYNKGEAGADFIYIRDMLTTSTSSGYANTAAMATVVFDNNYKASYQIGTGAALVEHIGADTPGAAGEWTSPGGSLPTDYKYSQVGPKTETYIDLGTAVAFKLSPDADVAENGLFQVSVRKFGDDTATFGYVLADGSVQKVATIDSYTSMFYNIDVTNCPKDGDDYIIVIGPISTGDGNNGKLALGMIKVNGYTVAGIELTNAATTDVTNTTYVIEDGLLALSGMDYIYNDDIIVNSVATPSAVELGDTITMKVIASANATAVRVLDADGNDVKLVSENMSVYGDYVMFTVEIEAPETAGEYNYKVTVSDSENRMSPTFSTETITVVE